MAGMDKVTRILLMYSKLSQGGKLHKKSFCQETEINRRTFDRDIEDIRLFLSEAFYGSDLVYDRKEESYFLKDLYKARPLSAMEVTFLLELLHSSRILRKDEYTGIADSLLHAGEANRRQELEQIAKRHRDGYPEEAGEALLKLQWDLQQCIIGRDVIMLSCRGGDRIRICPVGLMAYGQEMYLFAYGLSEALEAIPIRDIESFQIKKRKFDRKLLEAFGRLRWEELRERLEEIQKESEEDR